MKERFWCVSCKNIFEAVGNKKEWNDPIYGPCMKYIASCPECKSECDEYREPSRQKTSSRMSETSCGRQCRNCEFVN